ncbi:MAG: hypothetical protein Q9207_007658, partial [Kuettlingeria erythrocarpa]
MPRITDLSPELLLIIVEHLLDDNQLDPSKGEKETADNSSAAINNWSRTSTYFYKLLSPFIFRYVVLRNTQKSGNALQFLVQSNQRANVKELHFKASFTGDGAHDHDERKIDVEIPSSIHSILFDLASFPNLQALVVDFDSEKIHRLDFGDFVDPDDRDQESEEQIVEAEGRQAWRALQRQTFDAISKDNSSRIRHLVVKTCPLKAPSLYGSEQMNEWLANLESFSFEVYAREEGADWCTNTFLGFQYYIENLDRHFLDSLSNVTRLTISGHAQGPIGLTEMHQALVPLRPDHVPKLRELQMGWYFIQDSFVDFLGAHSSTLERLTLNHCFMVTDFHATGAEDDWDDNGALPDDIPSWYRFFHAYASSKPTALRHVNVKPENARLDHNDATENVLKTCKEQGKERRAFAYAEVDDDYGVLFENDEENSRAVRRGMDMRGWEELMEVVRANRE